MVIKVNDQAPYLQSDWRNVNFSGDLTNSMKK